MQMKMSSPIIPNVPGAFVASRARLLRRSCTKPSINDIYIFIRVYSACLSPIFVFKQRVCSNILTQKFFTLTNYVFFGNRMSMPLTLTLRFNIMSKTTLQKISSNSQSGIVYTGINDETRGEVGGL